MSQQQSSKRYDPYAIRRCVRPVAQLDGIHAYKTKSFTRSDGAEYFPMVDTRTGEMHCTCPDWQYRGQKTSRPCKHLARLISNLARKGAL